MVSNGKATNRSPIQPAETKMKLISSTIEGTTIIFEFEGGQILKAQNWGTGDKVWYLNGNFHREDGPAIEWANGDKSWYLNGEWLSEAEFNQRKPK